MRVRFRLVILAFLIGLSVVAMTLSAATNKALADQSPFGTSGAVSDQQHGAFAPLTRLADSAWSVLLFEQHKLTQEMTGAVRELKSTTTVTAATGALVVASFIYGVLHAVGPGHGKAVISSYMLADKQTLRRGVFLAFLSSFVQALSAIVLIGGLFLATKATGLQTRIAEAWLETASWGCVALLGAWLMIKELWILSRGQMHSPIAVSSSPSLAQPSVSTDPGYLGGEAALQPAAPFEIIHPKPHVHDAHCNHALLPSPDELKGNMSWGKAFALALSIGIRPCTGALLVIVFASAQGLIWAGVLATFAMAIGTAITVSLLAALSVGSRNLAVGLAGRESRWGTIITSGASLISSAMVFLLGSAFFVASFHPLRPF